MNRRDALSAVALLMGGTIVGANVFLTGCNTAEEKPGEGMQFTDKQIAWLDEVAETIIPTTSTPGAKAAKVGAFMNVMVRDCYTKDEQEAFKAGFKKLEDACKAKFSKGFMDCTPEQRKELLTALDAEQKEFQNTKKKEEPKHYFRLMKELTLLGYFTSEIGSKQAMRYVETPGRFDACVPYKKGEKLWVA